MVFSVKLPIIKGNTSKMKKANIKEYLSEVFEMKEFLIGASIFGLHQVSGGMVDAQVLTA